MAFAAVDGGVAVEDLLPATAPGNPDPEIAIDLGAEVADHQRHICLAGTLAQEGEHALIGAVGLDPGETVGPAIELMESRLGPVLGVEVAHPALEAAMAGIVQQVPVEAALKRPFLPTGRTHRP